MYNEKELAVISDLRELQNKHGVKLKAHAQYGENGYLGKDWELSSEEHEICVEFDDFLLKELESVK